MPEASSVEGDEGGAKLFATYDKSDAQRLISLIDDIRKMVGGVESISLPEILFLGDQSSGKSSCIEALCGAPLPRGSGICTRVPIVFCFKRNTSLETPQCHVSYSCPERDIEVVREAVAVDSLGDRLRQAQVEIAGRRNGVVDCPVTVSLESADVPDLTIIDLPGIARTAEEGQPKDIHDQIVAMIEKYARKERTIMVTVFAAVNDPATCEAFNIAEDLDPQGERTLGLITKCDRWVRDEMDLTAQLSNKGAIKLKLGYIAVRNSTQEELDAGITPEEAAEVEQEFFSQSMFDPCRDAGASLGRAALAETVTAVLVNRIERTLPGVAADLEASLKATSESLADWDRRTLGVTESGNDLRGNLKGLCVQLVAALQERLVRRALPGVTVNLAPRLRRHCDTFSEAVRHVCTEKGCFEGYPLPEKGEGEEGLSFLDRIGKILDENRGLYPPGIIDPIILDVITAETCGNIRPHFDAFCEAVDADVSAVLEEVVIGVVGESPVLQWIRYSVGELFKEVFADARVAAEKCMRAESLLQLTANHYMTETVHQKRVDFLVKQSGLEYIGGGAMYRDGIIQRLRDGFSKLSTTEMEKHEASFLVSAYLKTIGKKLGDSLSQIYVSDAVIDREKTTGRLLDSLLAKLDGMDTEGLEALLRLSRTDRDTIKRLREAKVNLGLALDRVREVLKGGVASLPLQK
ncbi:dynamin superfamily protein [Kipferlia bialata]|uniref:Dynamin superfamily protein n=1 Tax=Kipferlia bialata TaxID=797122 RepID=A0A9K3CTI1_9EUKA|nr:dynamin superfamily protein [Kipferlia bialata]|eukprot:g3303.t1